MLHTYCQLGQRESPGGKLIIEGQNESKALEVLFLLIFQKLHLISLLLKILSFVTVVCKVAEL